jgi:hypothetical protein
MGTINYKTSDFITLGYNCDTIDYNEEFYDEYIQDFFDMLTDELKTQDFLYFMVTAEPGYYEGYSICIDFNTLYFADKSDKAEAQKEVTRLKKFLLKCIDDFECVAVSPGWCTSYADYKTTLQKLGEAVKAMREKIKTAPTFRQYYKKGA